MEKLLIHKLSALFLALLLAGMVGVLTGCSGDDGAPGAAGKSAFEIAQDNGFTGTEQEWLLQQQNVNPESCSTCHNGTVVRSGVSHQDAYDELFQQGVVVVSNIAYNGAGGNDVVTFKMTKNGVDFDCRDADALNIRFSEYTGTGFVSIDTTVPPDGAIDLYSIKATTLTYDGAGGCTSTNPQGGFGDLSLIDGIIAVYGQDELVDSGPPGAHLALARYPFAGILLTGPLGVDYVSAANVTGCENCHTTPYYKHGYIRGDVGAGVGDLDFYTCKVCHVDNRDGGHEAWQIAVDNPKRWAEIFNGDDLTPEEEVQYAYKTRLMNDVHMSHAMEFPYPQSMANCATCHANKLAQTISDANFVIETCKSCHPVTGGKDYCDRVDPPDLNSACALDEDDNEVYKVDTTPLALETLLPTFVTSHNKTNWGTTPCNGCHTTGGIAPVFSSIHTGLNPEIYAADGTKYADAITVTINAATLTGTDLKIDFSGSGTAGGLSAAGIVPNVYVAAYGYDTKDFLISNHERDADRNRLGEYTFGGSSPYFSNETSSTDAAAGTGSWSITFDTTVYDAEGLISDGTIRRLEIAIAPTLTGPDGTVGLDAPSRTFDLDTGGFEAGYFSGTNALVKVAKTADADGVVTGCNTCHDQLATTFHSGNRGGNIVVCRMCHVVTNGGSHLQGQSRSIDSYVHAVHSFQPFDIDEIDFFDPVEEAHYVEHTEFFFPNFSTINCMACHNQERVVDNGTRAAFDVPDQAKSMPGLLSATDEIPGVSALTPEVVTGPAARACGGCHRAQKLNEGDTGGAASFNSHTKGFGYRVENDADDNMLYTIIFYIMDMFE